ncbi:hypothetical protein [Streptomyces sp. NPDC057694]|uniref:hypothetical protein n=1 Tax=Streptomyces sp. NPDC057694 TaxID=3346216 RepID=UPI0036A4BDC6
MACRDCTGHHTERLAAYPAGNNRSSLRAAERATRARTEAPGDVHVHYDAIHDDFVVMRTDTLTTAA